MARVGVTMKENKKRGSWWIVALVLVGATVPAAATIYRASFTFNGRAVSWAASGAPAGAEGFYNKAGRMVWHPNPDAGTETEASLPEQTGNAGKFLGTDGTVASWQTAGGGGGSIFIATTAPLGGGTGFGSTFTLTCTTCLTGSLTSARIPQASGTTTLTNSPFAVSGNGIQLATPGTINFGGTDTGMNLGGSSMGSIIATAQRFRITQNAQSAVTALSALSVVGGAHLNLTASTEYNSWNLALNQTVQFATGNITTLRSGLIQATTYGFVGASIITNAATVAITGPPIAGTNATITNTYALWLQAGNLGVAPAAQIRNVSQGATNTTGLTVSANVADGASSRQVVIQAQTSVANAAAEFLTILNVSTKLLGIRPNNTDGFALVDGGASALSRLGLSSNAGTTLCYSTACFSAGSGSITITDNTASWTLTGGVFQGPRLRMQQVNSSQTAALVSARDSANNAHWGVDAIGLPSLGSRFEWRENFLWLTTNLAAGTALTAVPNSGGAWSWSSSANATGFINATGFTTGSPITTGFTIGSGTASTNNSLMRMGATYVTPAQLTNLYIVNEWAAAISAVGTNDVTVRMGSSNAALSAANPGGWYFQKASTDTNWQCVTNDGAASTTTNSTVPPVANTAQQFRIEYYGSGTVLGALTVKFYINNALVCTNTANVYAANTVFWNTYITATNTVAQRTVSAGPLLLMYNQVANPLVP